MRVGSITSFPTKDRWICTIEQAKEKTELVPRKVSKGLDSLLQHFGLEKRNPKEYHHAYVDCVKVAEIYMKLNPK